MNVEKNFNSDANIPLANASTDLELQTQLTLFNRFRLNPSVTNGVGFHSDFFERQLRRESEGRRQEALFLQTELDSAEAEVGEVPTDPEAFIAWFESLKSWGPGQGDPLFPWLAESATIEQMRWFIGQEVAGEAGFDDLVAMTQVRMPVPVKLELARNYWDEMGRGKEKGMHGPMLSVLAKEIEIEDKGLEETIPEALALGNLMVGFAANRSLAYHSLGCLGAVELTAPDRARAVYQGLKRLGISPVGQRYYLLHSTLDVQHSITWNQEALLPLIKERPECARPLAIGAWLRLRAGARCFERYREILGVPTAARGVPASLHLNPGSTNLKGESYAEYSLQ